MLELKNDLKNLGYASDPLYNKVKKIANQLYVSQIRKGGTLMPPPTICQSVILISSEANLCMPDIIRSA